MANISNALSSILGQFTGEYDAKNHDLNDTSEKHGRSGIPMEVLGLMLGEFVDDYTVRVVDVFSMPQKGNTVSVESVDPVYQAEMKNMLRRVNRNEQVVGWYHSHPGFGCWFSATDMSTQETFEQLDKRAVGVVVDPVQSVKGTVVISCFRLMHKNYMGIQTEGRQINSCIGHVEPPNITAVVHGLNKHYYSLVIDHSVSQLDERLLVSLLNDGWSNVLKPKPILSFREERKEKLSRLVSLTNVMKTRTSSTNSNDKDNKNNSQVVQLNMKKHLNELTSEMLNDVELEQIKINMIRQIL